MKATYLDPSVKTVHSLSLPLVVRCQTLARQDDITRKCTLYN